MADEMTWHLLDRDPRFQLVDVRDPAEFGKMSLPGAVNLPLDSLASKASREALGQAGAKKVFFANDEAGGVRVATLAGLLGYSNVAVLEGGLDASSGRSLTRAPQRTLCPLRRRTCTGSASVQRRRSRH